MQDRSPLPPTGVLLTWATFDDGIEHDEPHPPGPPVG
jgi:hypothetical protein